MATAPRPLTITKMAGQSVANNLRGYLRVPCPDAYAYVFSTGILESALDEMARQLVRTRAMPTRLVFFSKACSTDSER